MKKFLKTRQVITFIFFLALFFITFLGGVYVGDQNRPEIEKVIGLSNKETQVMTTADFSSFWKVWNTINEKYPKADKITDQNRVLGYIGSRELFG